MRQTERNGVIVDISGAKFSNEDAIEKTMQRLARSKGSYAIILRNGELVAYISRE